MIVTLLLPLLFFLLYLAFIEKPGIRITEDGLLCRNHTDFLRGMAILIIMMMHSSCSAGQRVFTPLGGIGVALFLVLSGYGLRESFAKKGLNGFWKKKMSRIFVPYAFFIILKTCITGKYEYFLSLQFLFDILCIKSSYWFISFIVYNYIAFWIVYRIKGFYKYRYFVFFMIGLFFFCFDNRIHAEQALSFPTGLWLSENKGRYSYFIHAKKRSWIAFIGILTVSLICLFIKQIPSIRELQGENLLFHAIELVHKYGFSICIILIISKFPPRNRASCSTVQKYL